MAEDLLWNAEDIRSAADALRRNRDVLLEYQEDYRNIRKTINEAWSSAVTEAYKEILINDDETYTKILDELQSVITALENAAQCYEDIGERGSMVHIDFMEKDMKAIEPAN